MMRGRMERTVRSGEPQAYTAAVADLWERVGAALARLERIAESPAELLAPLGEGRDATAEIAAALETGEHDLVAPLLSEWRGTLFRVRLARLRTVDRRDAATPPAEGRR